MGKLRVYWEQVRQVFTTLWSLASRASLGLSHPPASNTCSFLSVVMSA